MRALWTGALSFGLINIPVRLYSGTEDHALSFTMLHKKDLSPIRYAKICKQDGKEVPHEDIVKGYEYKKGDYIVLDDEDFKKANLKKTKTIEIQDFTAEEEIDTIYFEKPYFLEPEKGAEKAYVILREALKKSKKIGVATFIFHNREHIAVIKPHDEILILNQLRYANEVRVPDTLKIPAKDLATAKEVTMALKLIDQLTAHFKPKHFHDTYTEELEQIIASKLKGAKIRPKGKEPKMTAAKDIMELLKKSLDEHHRKKAA